MKPHTCGNLPTMQATPVDARNRARFRLICRKCLVATAWMDHGESGRAWDGDVVASVENDGIPTMAELDAQGAPAQDTIAVGRGQ